MEFLKDYDFTIAYHPSKENVIADAVSRMKVVCAGIEVRGLKIKET